MGHFIYIPRNLNLNMHLADHDFIPLKGSSFDLYVYRASNSLLKISFKI